MREYFDGLPLSVRVEYEEVARNQKKPKDTPAIEGMVVSGLGSREMGEIEDAPESGSQMDRGGVSEDLGKR